MKQFYILLAITFCAFSAQAQTPYSLMGASYSQDFNSLPKVGEDELTMTGWSLDETGSGFNANDSLFANDGSSNSGDAKSYGADSSATDRALGSVSSGSCQVKYGMALMNMTGSGITSFEVTYTGEQWRMGSATRVDPDTLYFEYSLNAVDMGDTNATWTAFSALDFLSIQYNQMSSGALDGNLAANKTSIMGTIPVSLANGNTIRLRWRDNNMAGADDGLAIDDLSISVTTTGGPLPPTVVALEPNDNATNVDPAISDLVIDFDQAVTSGAGDITVFNLTDATQQVIAASTTTMSGTEVTIPAVMLSPMKDYAVQIDSTAFDVTGVKYVGIYNNTTWNFSTGFPTALTDIEIGEIAQVIAGATLNIKLDKSGSLEFKVLDLSGRVLSNDIVQVSSGVNNIDLGTSQFPSGIYILQVDGASSFNLKFVK